MLSKLTAAKIALIYLLVAGLWITLTDQFMSILFSDPELRAAVQTYKGIFYVLVTTGGLYLLIKKHDSQVAEQENTLQERIEEHKAERELLEKLFDRIPVMINSYSPDKNQFQINKEFEQVTGWDREEARNADLTQACFPDPELREEVKAFMDEPHSGWREFPMTTKSGEQIQTTWTNIHLEDNSLVGIGLDITERKKNEQTLKFQQQKLEQAQELAGIGYWEFDVETNKLTWSDGLYSLHPLSPDTPLTPEKFKQYVHPEDQEQFEQFIPTITEQGKTEITIRAQNAEGNMGYFFAVGEVLTQIDDEPAKLFGTVIDVTDVKKSEIKAYKSERLLRNTFNSLHSSVFVVEPETRKILDCNKHTEEMFGYSQQELIGNSTRMLHVDEEHYQRFDKKGKDDLIENGVFNTEFKMQRKNGDVFYTDHTVSLVFDDKGNIERVVSVVRDITERKQYERQLKRSKERLHRAQRVGKLGDWEYYPQSGDISWSPMVYEIYERDPEKGPPAYDKLLNVYHSENTDLLHEKVTNAIKKGEPYDLDLRLFTEGHKRKFIRVIGIPTTDKTGKVIMLRGTIQDVTDRKIAEKRALNSIIEGEERERKRIAKELHDGLGQYLSASNMNFQAVKQVISELPDQKARQFRTGLQLLQNAIRETRNIAHNLMPTVIEDYGLELAVRALIDKLKQASDITFSFSCRLDSVQLRQQAQINLYRVIQEALNNAIKYAQCSTISLQLYTHDHTISCMIEDDGIGASIDAEAENQGMGIRSMKTRVQALSGTIDFESSKGSGMTILIELPLQPNISKE